MTRTVQRPLCTAIEHWEYATIFFHPDYNCRYRSCNGSACSTRYAAHGYGNCILKSDPLEWLADSTADREFHPALKIEVQIWKIFSAFPNKKTHKGHSDHYASLPFHFDPYSRFFLTPSRNTFILPLSFSFTIPDRYVNSSIIFFNCPGVLGLKRISVRR